MYNWDVLEEGQTYEILFSCDMCGLWWHYTRQQKKSIMCECGDVHIPDHYTIIEGDFLGTKEVVEDDTGDNGRMEEDMQRLQGC